MRKRSDKDKPTASGAQRTVQQQQVASTNSTLNLFLGGSNNRARSWMSGNGSASSSTALNANAPVQASNRSMNTTNTTVLPSPAPSDEASPAGEKIGSAAVREERVEPTMAQQMPVSDMMGGANTHTDARAGGSSDTQLPPMRSQQGNGNNDVRSVRNPGAQLPPIILHQGGRAAMQSPLQSPSIQQPAMVYANYDAAWQQHPSTQHQPQTIQQRRANYGPQDMQSPAQSPMQSPSMHQPLPAVQQGRTNFGPQGMSPMQSPLSQQSTPAIQQANTPTEGQATGNPSAWPALNPQYRYNVLLPDPPAKRRKMTSANHPSLKPMLPLIDGHVASHGGIEGLKGNIERQRFNMLQKACATDDYFYVALHQIFCLWSLDPVTAVKLVMPQGKTVLNVAFAIVGQLLMKNTALDDAHTRFFAIFPNHLSELMYRSDHYSLTVNNVAIFLVRLAQEWPKYIPECAQRGYPPLVDELVNRFGLLSPILQHIIFTATRRNLGFPDDEYSAQMEQTFNQDIEAHRQMAARVNTAYPPTAREIKERNEWQANQYFAIRAMQIQRMDADRQAQSSQQTPPPGPNMARPSQQSLPGRVQSPSNAPSGTQAGQPHLIRTNVMPSHVLTASPQSTTAPSPYHILRPSQPVSAPQTPNGAVPAHPYTLQSQSAMPTQQNVQYQAQNMQQAYGPYQAQNMPQRQGQVNDIVRTASRNASRNASGSYFAGVGSAGSSPVFTNPVRRSSAGVNGTPAIATMPAGQSSLQQQQVGRIPLIPPAGSIIPYQYPQPDRSALHQAHLRSPVMQPRGTNEGLEANQPPTKLYQAVQGFAAGPTMLLDPPFLTELSVVVPKDVFPNIAEDKHSGPTEPMLREIRQGSLQYRVRCCRMNGSTLMEPSEFVVADTNWPPNIFMEMNDSVLEIRRRNHHGKDRPVDVTPHVFERGPKMENMLKISVPRPPKTAHDILYAVAIEVVEVFQHQQIVDMCLKDQRITARDMIEDIKAKLSSTNIEDDDVALVSSNLTIDLADPFTSRIFTTPVRGVKCRHRECFDLETFLISRSSKPDEVACMPDVWKCPLCGGDASPRSLRVDDFLVSVREKLEKMGELDVKAILVTEDGSWTVKPEAPPVVRRKSRVGTGGSVMSEESERSSPAVLSRKGSKVVEVIEVDDD
ncbi:hypothetical protein O988_06427 [Pseudogymnoascus sp. VKM F-3808]|nr:hypothetical protein O988_06427 [Pseudogymnoascus sp. VKM F-3808]